MHGPRRLTRGTASIEPDLQPLRAAAPPRRSSPRIARRQSSHGARQEFADRHWRPRDVAEHPLVLGQEQGRNLPEAGEQWPLLLVASGRGGGKSIAPEQRRRALGRGLRRGIGGGNGWLDRQRLVRAWLQLARSGLLRLLAAAC